MRPISMTLFTRNYVVYISRLFAYIIILLLQLNHWSKGLTKIYHLWKFELNRMKGLSGTLQWDTFWIQWDILSTTPCVHHCLQNACWARANAKHVFPYVQVSNVIFHSLILGTRIYSVWRALDMRRALEICVCSTVTIIQIEKSYLLWCSVKQLLSFLRQ